MSYVLSEKEFSTLESVADQIAFVTGLMTLGEGPLSEVDSMHAWRFLSAREGDLRGLVRAAEERAAALKSERMHACDWLHALRIARGDAHKTPSGTEGRIAQRLAALANEDETMAQVLHEWRELLAARAVCS